MRGENLVLLYSNLTISSINYMTFDLIGENDFEYSNFPVKI